MLELNSPFLSHLEIVDGLELLQVEQDEDLLLHRKIFDADRRGLLEPGRSIDGNTKLQELMHVNIQALERELLSPLLGIDLGRPKTLLRQKKLSTGFWT